MNMKINEMFQSIGALEERLHTISGTDRALEALGRVRRAARELRDEMTVPATERRVRQLRLFELLIMASEAIDGVFLQGIDSTASRDLLEMLYELVPELEGHLDHITPAATVVEDAA